jgi:CheY-like chemotaxis protein
MAERKRILLLHHDEDSLITLQWILENQGFDTTCTWDHAEAAGLMKSGRFDVVVFHEHALKSASGELLASLQLASFQEEIAGSPLRVVIPADSRLSAEHIAALASSAEIANSAAA